MAKARSDFGFTGQAADTFGALQGGMNKAANYDPTQARDAAIKSNYDQSMSRLNPRLMQQQSQFGAGAANSGLEPGTEAYNNANQQLYQGQNDALQTAMAGAIRQGNETQQTQMEQMRQPFLQAGGMMDMLGKQGNNLNQPLLAAGMQQKAADNAADREAAASAGKKGGAGCLHRRHGRQEGQGHARPQQRLQRRRVGLTMADRTGLEEISPELVSMMAEYFGVNEEEALQKLLYAQAGKMRDTAMPEMRRYGDNHVVAPNQMEVVAAALKQYQGGEDEQKALAKIQAGLLRKNQINDAAMQADMSRRRAGAAAEEARQPRPPTDEERAIIGLTPSESPPLTDAIPGGEPYFGDDLRPKAPSVPKPPTAATPAIPGVGNVGAPLQPRYMPKSPYWGFGGNFFKPPYP